MAYDKMVDSAVLDAGLKQIADAIRAKGGTSDNLAFPAAMADAIAAIESGGADLSQLGYTKTSCGSITPTTSNVQQFIHNLGVMPKLIMVFTDDDTTVLNAAQHTFFYSMARAFTNASGESKTFYAGVTKESSGTSFINMTQSIKSGTFNANSNGFIVGVSSVDENKFYLKIKDAGGKYYYMCKDVTYYWVCLG